MHTLFNFSSSGGVLCQSGVLVLTNNESTNEIIIAFVLKLNEVALIMWQVIINIGKMDTSIKNIYIFVLQHCC